MFKQIEFMATRGMMRLHFEALAADGSGPPVGVSAHKPVDVAPVRVVHPVPFDLLTYGDRRFVAFYNAARNMTVAPRTLCTANWQFVRLPSQSQWDSHNSLTMATDRDRQIYLASNMHAAAQIYFRTTGRLDIVSFEQVSSMA